MKNVAAVLLGLCLIVPSSQAKEAGLVNAEQARRLRQVAGAVSTLATIDQAVFGKTADTNDRAEVLDKVNPMATHAYHLLASAMEEGELVMKFTRVLQQFSAARQQGITGSWYVGDNLDKTGLKDVGFAVLSQSLREAGHEAVDRAYSRFANEQINKISPNKGHQRVARRTIRTGAYALVDALVKGLLTFAENSCYARADENKESAFDNSKDEFIRAAWGYGAYEIAGEFITRYVIEADPAITEPAA